MSRDASVVAHRRNLLPVGRAWPGSRPAPPARAATTGSRQRSSGAALAAPRAGSLPIAPAPGAAAPRPDLDGLARPVAAGVAADGRAGHPAPFPITSEKSKTASRSPPSAGVADVDPIEAIEAITGADGPVPQGLWQWRGAHGVPGVQVEASMHARPSGQSALVVQPTLQPKFSLFTQPLPPSAIAKQGHFRRPLQVAELISGWQTLASGQSLKQAPLRQVLPLGQSPPVQPQRHRPDGFPPFVQSPYRRHLPLSHWLPTVHDALAPRSAEAWRPLPSPSAPPNSAPAEAPSASRRVRLAPTRRASASNRRSSITGLSPNRWRDRRREPAYLPGAAVRHRQ